MAVVDLSAVPGAAGVYRIRHIESGKSYIGSSVNIRSRWATHLSELKRGSHHARYLQRAWDKHGPAAFVVEVVELIDDEPTRLDRESFHIASGKCADPAHGYNSAPVGGTCLGFRHSEETRAKMRAIQSLIPPEVRRRNSASFLGRKHTDETKAKMSANSKRVSPTAEHRAAISALHKGKTISAEHRAIVGAAAARKNRTPEMRAKVSAAMKGRVFSEEHREKIAESRRGRPIGDEHRAKLSAALQGRVFSDEHKAKITAALKAMYAQRKLRAAESVDHGNVAAVPLNLAELAVVDDATHVATGPVAVSGCIGVLGG